MGMKEAFLKDVHLGDTVTVMFPNGAETTGVVEVLEDEIIRLRTDGRMRILTFAAVISYIMPENNQATAEPPIMPASYPTWKQPDTIEDSVEPVQAAAVVEEALPEEQPEVPPEEKHGMVHYFNRRKGFGFISSGKQNYYFSGKSILDPELEEWIADIPLRKCPVSFTLGKNEQGLCAQQIHFPVTGMTPEEHGAHEQWRSGVIRSYNAPHAFGFILCNEDQKEYFFHLNQVEDRDLAEQLLNNEFQNKGIRFVLALNQHGLCADEVQLEEKEPVVAPVIGEPMYGFIDLFNAPIFSGTILSGDESFSFHMRHITDPYLRAFVENNYKVEERDVVFRPAKGSRPKRYAVDISLTEEVSPEEKEEWAEYIKRYEDEPIEEEADQAPEGWNYSPLPRYIPGGPVFHIPERQGFFDDDQPSLLDEEEGETGTDSMD